MRSRFRFRRSRVALGIVVGALALMALGPATASAQHFEDTSAKSCGAGGAGVSCTLTIGLQDDNGTGIPPGDLITVDLVPGTTGAAYHSATHAGGTCPGAVIVTVLTPTQLQVDPQHGTDLDDCTIVVDEALNARSDGLVCQTLNTPVSDSFQVCDTLAVCDGVTHPGTAGPDNIPGTAGRDVIDAGAGDDTVQAGGGDDVVCGRDGNDTLRGGAGADNLLGELGNDALFGDAGDDFLDGGAGRDTGNGGPGGGTDSATGVEKPTNIP